MSKYIYSYRPNYNISDQLSKDLDSYFLVGLMVIISLIILFSLGFLLTIQPTAPNGNSNSDYQNIEYDYV